MSKRGSYLGGHSIFRGTRPWWNPEDISLKDSGLLNDPKQFISDRDIIIYVADILPLLGPERISSGGGQNTRIDSERLYKELGFNRAFEHLMTIIEKELSRRPNAMNKEVRERLENIRRLSNPTPLGKKKSRLGKRERELKRELIKRARHPGQ